MTTKVSERAPDPLIRDALRCTTLPEALLVVASDVWDGVTARADSEEGGSLHVREDLRREWMATFTELLSRWTLEADGRAVATLRRLQQWIDAYGLDAVADLQLDSPGGMISWRDHESGARFEIPWRKFWNDNALQLTAKGLEWEADRLTEEPLETEGSFLTIVLAEVKASKEGKKRMAARKGGNNSGGDLSVEDKHKIALDFTDRAKKWALHHGLDVATAYLRRVDEGGVYLTANDNGQPKTVLVPPATFWGALPKAGTDNGTPTNETTSAEPTAEDAEASAAPPAAETPPVEPAAPAVPAVVAEEQDF